MRARRPVGQSRWRHPRHGPNTRAIRGARRRAADPEHRRRAGAPTVVRSLRIGGRRRRQDGSGHVGRASDGRRWWGCCGQRRQWQCCSDTTLSTLPPQEPGAGCAATISAFVGAVALRRDRQPGGDTGCRRRRVGGSDRATRGAGAAGLSARDVGGLGDLARRLAAARLRNGRVPAACRDDDGSGRRHARRGAGVAGPDRRRTGLDDGVAGGSGRRSTAGGATVRTVVLGVARRCRAPRGARPAHPQLARHGSQLAHPRWGTLLTAVLSVRPLEASAFIAVVTVILLSRSRTHVDRGRVAALVIGAGIAASAFIGLVAVRAPWTNPWLCGLPIAGAAIVIALGTADLSLSPTADRVMSVVEYAVGAAVDTVGVRDRRVLHGGSGPGVSTGQDAHSLSSRRYCWPRRIVRLRLSPSRRRRSTTRCCPPPPHPRPPNPPSNGAPAPCRCRSRRIVDGRRNWTVSIYRRSGASLEGRGSGSP